MPIADSSLYLELKNPLKSTPLKANLKIRRFVFSFLKDYIPQQVEYVNQTIHIECMQAVSESRIEWLNAELERVAQYSDFRWLKGSTFMLKLLRDVRIVIQGLFAYSREIFNDPLDYLDVSQYLRNAAQDLAHACGDDQKNVDTPKWMKTRNKTDINDYVKLGRKFKNRSAAQIEDSLEKHELNLNESVTERELRTSQEDTYDKREAQELSEVESREKALATLTDNLNVPRTEQNTSPLISERLSASNISLLPAGKPVILEGLSLDELSEMSTEQTQANKREQGEVALEKSQVGKKLRTSLPAIASEDGKIESENQNVTLQSNAEENCVWGLMILALDDFTGSKAVEVIPMTIAEILENALDKPNSFAFHLGQAGRHSPPMPSDYITMFGIVTPLRTGPAGGNEACKKELPVLARQTLERAYASGIMDFSCSVGLAILDLEDPSADSSSWYHRAVNSLIIARSLGLNQIGPVQDNGTIVGSVGPERRTSLCLSLGNRTDISHGSNMVSSSVTNGVSPPRISNEHARDVYHSQVEKQKKKANKPLKIIRFGDLLQKSREAKDSEIVIASPFVTIDHDTPGNEDEAEPKQLSFIIPDPNRNPRKDSQISEVSVSEHDVSFKSAEVIRQLQIREHLTSADTEMLIERLKSPRELNYATPVYEDTLLLVALGLRRSVTGALSTDGKMNNEMVKFLLSSGEIKVNQTNKEGISPLMIASMMGKAPLLQWLLDLGAEPNLTTSNGKTALILAVQHCCSELSGLSIEESKEIVRVLISSDKILPDKPDRVGRTALVHAAKIGNNVACRLLIEKKCDVNILPTHDFGKTPLMWASCTSNRDLLKVLLEAKADPNMKTKNGSTPLHLAASQPDPEICILLTDADADLYTVNNAGMTALMIAVSFLRRDVVHMMLCKLDAEWPRRKGYKELRNKALAIAQRKGTKGIIELFSADG